MGTYAIGSVTFVISDNRQHHLMDDDGAEYLAKSLADYFKYQLAKHELDEIVTIAAVDMYRGCITVIISLNMVAGAGVGGLAIVEFLKNYKDVRDGLDRLLADLKNVKIFVKKKFFKKKAVPGADTVALPGAAPEAERAGTTFEVSFQQRAEQYESIAPEQKKLWAAGQEHTIIDEKSETGERIEKSEFTLSIKREDIHAPEEPVE